MRKFGSYTYVVFGAVMAAGCAAESGLGGR